MSQNIISKSNDLKKSLKYWNKIKQIKDAKIIFTSELNTAYSTNQIICDMIIRSRLTQEHTAKVDP